MRHAPFGRRSRLDLEAKDCVADALNVSCIQFRASRNLISGTINVSGFNPPNIPN
jgi:hypothetical protein